MRGLRKSCIVCARKTEVRCQEFARVTPEGLASSLPSAFSWASTPAYCTSKSQQGSVHVGSLGGVYPREFLNGTAVLYWALAGR